MAGIIRQLLDFSRRRGPKLGPANLQQVVARALELLASTASARRVRLDLTSDAGPLLVRVDQSQMQQVLSNIVLNGIQAMPGGGHLGVRLGAARRRPPAPAGAPEGDYCCITVEDEGQGIAPGDLAHVFEPFFTTKETGEGTGLGLAVAHGIVAEHGGWIEVASEVGRGSRFTIFLPPAAGTHADLVEVAS
jgi:signal transduction histidine kinase